MVQKNELYEDPLFVEPFIDKDEWRDEPVRHRYVHGGFKDTDLRFSMYFPPKEQYDGRFFHPLMHIAGNENGATQGALAGFLGDSIQFAAASGAYLVESNLGSKLMMGPGDIVGFRASAATAQYGRILAAEMYGDHRAYGYCYGGSGGAYKTLSSVENTRGIWDGCVPFIHGSPVSLPNVFTVQAHALRVLDGKLDQIVDAIEPGGSGDMYAGLNEEEAGALREVTGMGMPPRAWFAHRSLSIGYTGVLASVIGPLFHHDPAYFTDFWEKPGYLGANPPQSLTDARVQHQTTIAALVSTDEMRAKGLPVSIAAGTRGSAPAAIRVTDMPEGRVQGAFLFPRSGPAAGQRLMITGTIGDLLLLGFGGEHIPMLEAMKVGDPIEIDNSDYLAAQTYHRHQNPAPEFYVWDQFREPDGAPIYPQRAIYSPNQAGEGNAFMSAEFDCKMIVVGCMMDEAAYPWQQDWYREKVKRVVGENYADKYRLWFVDRAMHVGPARYVDPSEGGNHPLESFSPADTHVVHYTGVLQQALRYLAGWAERGIAPPEETGYRVDDGQVHLADTASERKGVQPVVTLTVNGKPRADIKVGEAVEFVGTIEVPPGAGSVTSAEWDYDGEGAYPEREEFTDGSMAKTVRSTYSFDKPGTYFVALRAGSQRDDAVGTSFARALNLGRVRVVVT
jgi:hypothetical protein